MDKAKQLTKSEKKLLIATGVIGTICVIVGAFLNIIGEGGLGYQHPAIPGIQALSLTVAQAFTIWVGSLFPIYPKDPRFPRRWRTTVATTVGLTSLLMGYLLSLLILNAHNNDILVATMAGPLLGSTPTLLFRIIEMRQAGREKEQQVTM